MTPESSPFRPGQPVQVELFVGRQASIERLRGLVRSANQGSFKIGFIAGERGIGKSSVASFVRYLCEKESGVTGCHVYLGGVHDLDDMARATFDRLLKDSIDRPWHQRLVEFFGNRIRQVGLFGVSVELNLTGHDLRTISTNFITAIRDLVTRLEAPNSLLIILDDINGLANSSDFAHWLKSIVDEIATSRKATKLCILLVGLEERRQELIAHQPSWSNTERPVPIHSAQNRRLYGYAIQSARGSTIAHPGRIKCVGQLSPQNGPSGRSSA